MLFGTLRNHTILKYDLSLLVFHIVGDFYSQHLNNMWVKTTGDKLNSDGLGSGSPITYNHTHIQYHLKF